MNSYNSSRFHSSLPTNAWCCLPLTAGHVKNWLNSTSKDAVPVMILRKPLVVSPRALSYLQCVSIVDFDAQRKGMLMPYVNSMRG